PEALAEAARGLQGARRTAVLTGGRLTLEDAYAYAKFARVALRTNDIDMRARAHSEEEAEFLAARIAGSGIRVTFEDLEKAPAVLLAGFEPEDESPSVFLRLRKAARKRGLDLYAVAPYASRGLAKADGTLIPAAPGTEAQVLDGLADASPEAFRALGADGAVLLAGERLAQTPGALSALARLADRTGARIGWVPRRAGERGAIEAGALPNLLPGGRPVGDAHARAEAARAWSVASLPEREGRDTAGILAAAAAGELDALVIAGVELDDLPDPDAARAALAKVPFIVSLELRASDVTDRADVVLPVAAVAEKSGTFVNWEGRERPFGDALKIPGTLSDLRVLAAVADEMDVHLGLPGRLGRRAGARPADRAGAGGRAGAGRGAAGHLEAAARPGPDGGRRALPGRDRPAGAGPALRGHRRRDRAGRRRPAGGHRAGRVGLGAGRGRRRDAGRGGVAARRRPRLRRPPGPGGVRRGHGAAAPRGRRR